MSIDAVLYLQTHQIQADSSGTLVTVSRQALDEALSHIALLEANELVLRERDKKYCDTIAKLHSAALQDSQRIALLEAEVAAYENEAIVLAQIAEPIEDAQTRKRIKELEAERGHLKYDNANLVSLIESMEKRIALLEAVAEAARNVLLEDDKYMSDELWDALDKAVVAAGYLKEQGG